MRIKSIILLFIVFLAASAPGLFAQAPVHDPSVADARPMPLKNVRVRIIDTATETLDAEYGLRVANAKYMRAVQLYEKREAAGLNRPERLELAALETELAQTVFQPFILGLGTAPQIGACRVTPRAVPWSEARTVPPYTPGPPLTHVHFDGCLSAFKTYAGENRTPSPFGDGLTLACQGGAVRFEIAFDGRFKTRFVDTVLTQPTIGFVLLGYDGLTDFAGLSGSVQTSMRQTLITVDADVDDPTLFLTPWDAFLRATQVDAVTILHQGANTSVVDLTASAGFVATYNP